MIKDKYRVTGYIRGGGFGDVFVAKHLKKNYEVAVKFGDPNNKEAIRQFENEVEVLKALKKSPRANLFPKLLASGKLTAE